MLGLRDRESKEIETLVLPRARHPSSSPSPSSARAEGVAQPPPIIPVRQGLTLWGAAAPPPGRSSRGIGRSRRAPSSEAKQLGRNHAERWPHSPPERTCLICAVLSQRFGGHHEVHRFATNAFFDAPTGGEGFEEKEPASVFGVIDGFGLGDGRHDADAV
jgi:hypothetical protein